MNFDEWIRADVQVGDGHPFTPARHLAAREWRERDLARHVRAVEVEESRSSFEKTLEWFKRESLQGQGFNQWR